MLYKLNILLLSTILLIYFICFILFDYKNITLYNITLFLFAAPFIEEYLFRKIVQSYIYKLNNKIIFKYFSLSNIITSFLFVLAHFIFNYENVLINLLIFIPFIYLGIVYEKYKNIWLNTLIHSIFNIIIFINLPVI